MYVVRAHLAKTISAVILNNTTVGHNKIVGTLNYAYEIQYYKY